ncbi:MAG: methionyl-tRNA formyltransferase [Legionellales bacterium]|nr:methionyl-tRNA formyltransferase [Legionellales bacterium]
MSKYIVASTHSWHLNVSSPSVYDSLEFIQVANQNEFNALNLEELSPEFIFFVHWNWVVPEAIFSKYKCVVFHIAPLPYGRGGSPIQNLILNGYEEAPVNALKMTKVLDGGAIYGSKTISFEGTISEIFGRAANVVEELIQKIIVENPRPIEQKGVPVYFRRLSEKDNALTESDSLEKIYDKIRMVDGFNYPRAFIEFGKNKMEFTDAKIVDGIVIANVSFKEKKIND